MRLGVKMMECDCTDYAFTVRDGLHRVVQYQYDRSVAHTYGVQGNAPNGTGLDPKWQAMVGNPGAFADLPGAIRTWRAADIP